MSSTIGTAKIQSPHFYRSGLRSYRVGRVFTGQLKNCLYTTCVSLTMNHAEGEVGFKRAGTKLKCLISCVQRALAVVVVHAAAHVDAIA